MKTVGFYTLGCKVAQYETEAIKEGFVSLGFSPNSFDEPCDAYVINTCTVTAESDRKSRQIIRRAAKRNPKAVIAVVGCYSQLSPHDVSKIEGVSVVVGTENKLSVVGFVAELLEKGQASEKLVKVGDLSNPEFEKMAVTAAGRTRAYIKIEDGCESKCTYCAIRMARGKVRSKPPQEVIAEAETLYKNGAREIVLTGIETGAYGKDFDREYGLADLICELDRRGSCERIRLGSLAPELVGASFAEKIKDVKILAPHFHLSMQSGSDSVLAKMRRRYNSKTALENIERLRGVFPNAEFTTDMMVGFPGETEEDFQASLEFIRKAEFLDVHVFSYSKRKGTEAYSYPEQIPEQEKHRRSRIMIEEKNKIRSQRLDLILKSGASLSVIAETRSPDGTYTAHADNFVEVRFETENDRNLQGELIKVLPVSHKNGIIYAKQMN